jgi:signal transduction histidine kinase
MSHELRTPLNAIGGYTELIEMGVRGPVSNDQRRDLHRIQTSQRHLLGLINEVLNYAKLESGSVVYDLADLPAMDAIESARELVSPQAEAKHLGLSFGTCSPDVRVRADPEKLQQILINLVSNAIKFTDPGGVIAVTCTVEGEQVRIDVSDTGCGIPADQMDQVFDPFVQVDRRLNRPIEGTGLGLAISRELAQGMGGTLTASSVVGSGSTFILRLPRA